MNLEYIGEVHIKTQKKSYSIKNSGTAKLFELFAKFLVGYTIDQTELPESVMLYKNKNTSTPEQVMHQPAIVTRSYRQLGNDPVAIFTAGISDTNISTITAAADYTLVLRDGTINKTELASIKIDASILSNITSGRQALIEWVIKVVNKSEDQ